MAGKRGEGLAQHITKAEPQQQRRIEQCAANGCPLAGTITTEGGLHVCGIHFLAKMEGWPKATGVILHHIALYDLARKAQSVGTPLSMSKESANLLASAAHKHGLEFNDAQREIYKTAMMKLTVAGQIVESSISARAVEASMTVVVSQSNVQPHEEEEINFNVRLRGLINNMSYQQEA